MTCYTLSYIANELLREVFHLSVKIKKLLVLQSTIVYMEHEISFDEMWIFIFVLLMLRRLC